MMQIRIMRSAGVMTRMQWRGGTLLSRRQGPAGVNIGWSLQRKRAQQTVPFFRMIGYDGPGAGRSRALKHLWRVEILSETAKKRAIKPLKTNEMRNAQFRAQ